MRIERYKQGRHWAVYDDAEKLVVVTVYKRGAEEVKRRLTTNGGIEEKQREATDTSAASVSFSAPASLRHKQERKDKGYGR